MIHLLWMVLEIVSYSEKIVSEKEEGYSMNSYPLPEMKIRSEVLKLMLAYR
jgi:hypothetical protein